MADFITGPVSYSLFEGKMADTPMKIWLFGDGYIKKGMCIRKGPTIDIYQHIGNLANANQPADLFIELDHVGKLKDANANIHVIDAEYNVSLKSASKCKSSINRRLETLAIVDVVANKRLDMQIDAEFAISRPDIKQRINNAVADYYTISRMLNGKHKNIIVYVGDQHARNISRILELLDFDETTRVYSQIGCLPF
jgi:hypothetical protein